MADNELAGEVELLLKAPDAGKLDALIAQPNGVAALNQADALNRLLQDARIAYFESRPADCATRIALVPRLIEASVEGGGRGGSWA
jgi:hypothetical protein